MTPRRTPARAAGQSDSWVVSAVCDVCLDSDTGRAILAGAVGIATLNDGPIERCILCGFPFADQVG